MTRRRPPPPPMPWPKQVRAMLASFLIPTIMPCVFWALLILAAGS